MAKAAVNQTGKANVKPKMSSDFKHVLKLCRADGVPVNLDLAEERQFNFLMNLRGGAKYLEKYFPHNHRLLCDARQRAIDERKKNAAPIKRHMTLLEKVAQGENVSDTWQDSIQIVGLVAQPPSLNSNSNGYQLLANGLINFVQGLQTLSATLQIYSTKTGEILGSNSMENLYENGYDTIITASGATNDIEGVEASMVIDYLPYNSNQKESKILKIPMVNTIDPISISVLAPVHKPGVNNVGFIKVCMGRQDGDCDYCYTPQPYPLPPTPTIAVKGNATFSGPITDPGAGSATFGALFFVKRREGGATQLFTDYSQIAKYFKVSGNTISWDFNPATFEKAPWTQGNAVDLNLTVQVSVNGKPKSGQFQITSLKSVPADQSVAKIDVLNFFWGCLGSDSRILMEDGSEKQINQIIPGEYVKSNDRCLEVLDIVTGVEEKPCLRIATKGGCCLLVTSEHPIAALSGFRQAGELHTGDLIYTLSGVDTIERITKEQYSGMVYNLKLRNCEDNDATHYANGILVGDGNIQGKLLNERKYEASRERIVDELPVEWRFDAENAYRIREGKELIPARS